jgi:hypothetical protein
MRLVRMGLLALIFEYFVQIGGRGICVASWPEPHGERKVSVSREVLDRVRAGVLWQNSTNTCEGTFV